MAWTKRKTFLTFFLFCSSLRINGRQSLHIMMILGSGKKNYFSHVLKVTISASLKLGHWHDVPFAPIELPVQRSLWVLEGQLVTKKSEHNVRSSTSPNPIVQSDPHNMEEFFSPLKMTWIHLKLVPDWKSLPLFMEVSLLSDDQKGIFACFICYFVIG